MPSMCATSCAAVLHARCSRKPVLVLADAPPPGEYESSELALEYVQDLFVQCAEAHLQDLEVQHAGITAAAMLVGLCRDDGP